MYAIDREQLAWAAGFFDGEGSMVAGTKRQRSVAYAQIGQSDRQVLDRFCAAVGVGKVYGPYGPYKTSGNALATKPHFTYRTRGYGEAQQVVCALWQWLGDEKREQAVRALRQVQQYPAVPQRRNRVAQQALRR